MIRAVVVVNAPVVAAVAVAAIDPRLPAVVDWVVAVDDFVVNRSV